jgi:hypothetical protein
VTTKNLCSENSLSTETGVITIVVYEIEKYRPGRVGTKHRGWYSLSGVFSVTCQAAFGNRLNIDSQRSDAEHVMRNIDVQAMKRYDAAAI